MTRKVIHLSLPIEVYYRFKERAKKEHLKLSTWIRKKMLECLNEETA